MDKPVTVLKESNPGNITFIDSHSTLKSGDYSINLDHHTDGTGLGGNVKDSFNFNVKFFVKGQRFNIDSSSINMVFPAVNSVGDFTNVIPHLVLNNISFPWQRYLYDPIKYPSQPSYPWVALLIFDENQSAQIKEVNGVALGEFTTQSLPVSDPSQVLFYNFSLEIDETSDQTCNVIDIPVSIFNQIAPSGGTLTGAAVEGGDILYLSHSRQVSVVNKASNFIKNKDTLKDGSDTQLFSVVTGNRQLINNGKYTIHLVVLEDMGSYLPNNDGSSNVPGKTYVRLVTLYKWKTEVKKLAKKLSDYIAGLNQLTPYSAPYTAPIALRLPDSGDATLDKSLSMGYTLINYNMRGGDQNIAWVRGPFTPYAVTNNIINSSVQNADSLLRYEPETSLFDVTYAAAWQIGRMLALQNKKFAQSICSWRKSNIKAALLKSIKNNIRKTYGYVDDGSPDVNRQPINGYMKLFTKHLNKYTNSRG